MTDTLIPDREQAASELADLRLRTDLFIDGDFRPARDGRRFVTENPATGQSITEVAEGGRGRRRRGRRGRTFGVRPRRVVTHGSRRTEAGPDRLGRPDRRERPRARPHRDDRRRQADQRHGRARHARDGRLHPLARRGDRQAVRPGRAVAGRHRGDDHARAGRRRRGGRAVELPGPDGGVEARAGTRDRQQRGDQAGVDDIALASCGSPSLARRRVSRMACSTS